MNKALIIFIILLISINSRGETISSHIYSLIKPNCIIKKNYKFLNKAKKAVVESELGIRINSGTIQKLDISCEKEQSSAFVFNDKIRTHYQTLLIMVKENFISAIKTIEFNEPIQYKAPKKWINSIVKKDSKNLFKVDALSGATLTRQSTLKMVKQALYYSVND